MKPQAKLKKLWLDIRDSILIQLEEESRKWLTIPTLIIAVFILLLGFLLFVLYIGGSSNKTTTKKSLITVETEKKPDGPTEELTKEQIEEMIQKQVHLFLKNYFTYDTQNMDRSLRIKSLVTGLLYQEEKHTEQAIRPTFELQTSQFVGVEDPYIQPMNESFLWTGTVAIVLTNQKGDKSQEKEKVSIVIEESIDQPQHWLISEVIIHDSQ